MSGWGVARTEDLELQGAVVPHAARVLRGVVVRVPLLPVARAVLQEERVDERLQRPARPEDRVDGADQPRRAEYVSQLRQHVGVEAAGHVAERICPWTRPAPGPAMSPMVPPPD